MHSVNSFSLRLCWNAKEPYEVILKGLTQKALTVTLQHTVAGMKTNAQTKSALNIVTLPELP